MIDEQGELNLLQILPEESPDAAPQPSQAEADGAPFALWVQKLDLVNAGVSLVDHSQATPLQLGFVPIDLHLQDLRLGAAAGEVGSPLDVSLALEGGGGIHIGGEIDVERLRATLDVEVDRFSLPQLQPLLDGALRAELRSGTLGLEGRLTYDRHETPAARFAGDIAVDDLVVHDSGEDQDVLRMASLRLETVAVAAEPLSLSIERIRLGEPYLRFAIAQDGSSNVARMRVAPAAGEEAAATPVTQTAPPEIRIGEITVENGSAWFEDLSLRPAFATAVQQLQGGIKGFTTAASGTTAVRLEGQTGPQAPVNVGGHLQLFAAEPALDVTLVFRNLDLTAFTPYSGRFAGYEIAKGRMDMDLVYALEGVRLKGSNKLLLDQLTLGKRVESPDALRLPVALGIALLKDAQGRIDLDLEVKGSVDDPEFSATGLVWRAIVNLLTKAVTQPFGALAALVGGKSPPESIDFEAGSQVLGATQATDLEGLATALLGRPGLVLRVEGGASAPLDAPELGRQNLEAALLRIHAEGLSPAAAAELKFLSLDERAKAIAALHARLTASGSLSSAPVPAPAVTPPAKPETAAEKFARLEAELLAAAPATRDELLGLARARAEHVANHLEAVGKVPAERILQVDPVLDEAAEGEPPRVRMSLDARP